MTANPKLTGERLLLIAIEQFGRCGRDGISTRKIAELANSSMSSITYHFGSKDGLYLAAARHIAKVMGAKLLPLLDALAIDQSTMIGPVAARAKLHELLGGLFDHLVIDDRAGFARFIIREQADPSDAFDILFEPNMRRIFESLAYLINCAAGGELMTQEARLRAMALAGSVLIFRFSGETMLRAGDWSKIDDGAARLLRHIIGNHLDAILDELKGAGSGPRRARVLETGEGQQNGAPLLTR